jgi:SAM-dependent methyltransferase
MVQDVWQAGGAYEAYVGRWSRMVARVFVPWLEVPAGRRWLDVGCGTGSLAATVLADAEPARVTGIDPSTGFLATARSSAAATFIAGDARALPLADGRFDAVISGLALNFVPDPARAVAECVRVAAPWAVVAAFVWDYADGMAMMRHFWDVAGALDPVAASLDEGRRFPLCRPDGLRELWLGAGLTGVTVDAIEVPTVFAGFDDYWQPFLGGQGAAPAYVATLDDERRATLREALRDRLGAQPGRAIPLTARAWAVQGERP